ncbi:MAG TPA: hypothetical protein P5121_25615 [Caldilineaceae bacterium]|nr:hypothetical protein [Caldilineaceae bacterium]
MSRMKVNQDAVTKAKHMIESHHYVLDSDWSEAQPSRTDENDYLDRHGWDGYGDWFLAIDTDGSKETKERYNFVYGDFQRVHRSGLIAAKQRAAQYDHNAIEKVADELLTKLDQVRAD